MIQRTCDCCGDIIASDKPFFTIRFDKFYDDVRCEGAIAQGMLNCLNQPVVAPDFCNKCTALIREHIRQMHKKYMGNNAKELNI